MERRAIERLAMDVALGELNEDAEALLDAYLSEHPDAKQWAQQMKTVCERTQKAIDAKTRHENTPVHVPASFARWRPSIRWAAVVTVSALIGAGISGWSASRAIVPAASVAVVTARNPGPRNWQAFLSKPDKGFWESKAATLLQSKPHRGVDPQPSLWEALRQLEKGHNHEQSRQ